MSRRPALLGESPFFESMVRLARPTLPQFDTVAGDVRAVLESGFLSKGRHLDDFEHAVAQHLGVRHAIAVSSGTTGLMLTYRALGLHGEVVVPSFTFMATVSALSWIGARPVFADVAIGTANLDLEAAAAAITPATTAIVAVHNHGNPADIDGLRDLTAQRGLRLIFDAAHAFGSQYKGRAVGSEGDASIFSLSFSKLLVAGEGGLVATNDDALAEQVRLGREYGNDGSYDSLFPGLNGRMGEFNALLALRSLPQLDANAVHRNSLALLYREELSSIPGIGFQEVRSTDRNSYKDLSITIDAVAFGMTRDELASALAAENIETRKYYDPPVHKQTAYRQFAPQDDALVNTMQLAATSLSIPIWSDMPASTVRDICSVIKCLHAFADEVRYSIQQKGSSIFRATGKY